MPGSRRPGEPRVPWWREAVFYQVYPRSFMDSNGDGEGDLRGVESRLDYLADLGVDALWLCPFYPSPDVDGGYDVSDYRDVDPRYGTLADFDSLLAAAHARGIRVTIDIVPNHCSDQHPWFRSAIASPPGSLERARFHFRPGKGPTGDEPPNNWTSVFGGPSWTRTSSVDGTPGDWYYHLFAPQQPDFNWDNPEILAEFESIVQFWLARGVDGFRIDVADGLFKDSSWPNTPGGYPIIAKDASSPVHAVYRRLRTVMDRFDGDRMAVVETGDSDDVVALFIRDDEMHLAFNLKFAKAPWSADSFRDAVTSSLAATSNVGAPVTWVLDNHDTPRSVSRFASDLRIAGDYVPAAVGASALNVARGRRRAAAAAVLQLSLPGAAYIYQGQELGLPNVDDLPDAVLRDPVFVRTKGAHRGRDGCRVPMPWAGASPQFDFTTGEPWLPMPKSWVALTAEAEAADPHSILALFRQVLALRRQEASLRGGNLEVREAPANVLHVRRTSRHGRPLDVVVNFGTERVALPAGAVLVASDARVASATLPADCAAIVAAP